MKIKKILWGVFFICAAALVILNQMGYFTSVGLPSLICTIVLVAILAESLVHLHFFGVFFPIALLAIIYAQPLGIDNLTPAPVLLAALFLTIACYIMFKPKRKHECFEHHTAKFKETVDNLDDDDLNCNVTFGSSTKYLHSTNLQSAYFSCTFGALKLFFDNATLHPEGATVNIDCSFGGVEMYIPKEWRVINNTAVTLGGVEEKNPHRDDGGPALTLTGKISFAGITITYI